MNDQARVVKIAANASSSDVHSANYVQRQLERVESISDSKIEAEGVGEGDGRPILRVLVGMADAPNEA
jgi:Tfp pilus assembly protein PilP